MHRAIWAQPTRSLKAMPLFRAPAIVLTLAAALIAATPLQPLKVRLYPLKGSHEAGTATIVQRGSNVIVTIEVTGMGSGSVQFAHLHRGTCEHIEAPTMYELKPVTGGHSTTRLSDITLATFSRATYSILIHKSASHSAPHVACGTISGG